MFKLISCDIAVNVSALVHRGLSDNALTPFLLINMRLEMGR